MILSGDILIPGGRFGRVRQKELAMVLSQAPRHSSPRAEWEQYSTPGDIAADVLFHALAAGHLHDQRVVDLGCGTGVFAVGAALLGARSVVGVDVDPVALSAATAFAEKMGVTVAWVATDVQSFADTGEVVVMNPPFGAQYSARGADLRFLEAARRCAGTSYSLHLADTAGHVQRRLVAWGDRAEVLARYEFRIPHQFDFHRKQSVNVDVALVRRSGMG